MKPTPPRSHGYSTSDASPVRSNLVKPGRFGLLFPELANVPWTTGDLAKDDQIAVELGRRDARDARVAGVIPAGFTYFGQFVDHDITFDPTSIGENAVDIGDLVRPAARLRRDQRTARRCLGDKRNEREPDRSHSGTARC